MKLELWSQKIRFSSFRYLLKSNMLIVDYAKTKAKNSSIVIYIEFQVIFHIVKIKIVFLATYLINFTFQIWIFIPYKLPSITIILRAVKKKSKFFSAPQKNSIDYTFVLDYAKALFIKIKFFMLRTVQPVFHRHKLSNFLFHSFTILSLYILNLDYKIFIAYLRPF